MPTKTIMMPMSLITKGGYKQIFVFWLFLFLAIAVIIFAEGAEYSKPLRVKDVPFGFLNDMLIIAKTDMKGDIPKSDLAAQAISFIFKVKDGKLFTVDSKDDFIGAEITLLSGQIHFCGLASEDEEQLVVDYYFKTKTIQTITAFFKRGDLKGLSKGATEFARVYPDYAGAWAQLGYTNLAQGKFAAAKANFSKSATLAPNFPKAIAGEAISDIYLNAGELTAFAKERITLLKEKDPDLSVFESEEMRYTARSREPDWKKVVEPVIGREIPNYVSPLKGKVSGELGPDDKKKLEEFEKKATPEEKKKLTDAVERVRRGEPITPTQQQTIDHILQRTK
jgi:tetratricopeptide (TPR) repeat protein